MSKVEGDDQICPTERRIRPSGRERRPSLVQRENFPLPDGKLAIGRSVLKRRGKVSEGSSEFIVYQKSTPAPVRLELLVNVKK